MQKIITSGSWDFGVEPTSLVKFASDGMGAYDAAILEKRASAEFVDLAKRVKLASGEVPLHLIAMGSTERFGPNRNGDGFKAAALRKYADTFVKHAMFYRNHKNKDRSKSYGVVKIAYFNEPMQRVELLVALNGNNKVAQDNGGLLADRELNLLESGADLPVSMACKVAYDVCSSCGNRAPSRKEYCKSAEEGGTCNRFGCATGLTKVSEDGHIQHVDNPHPSFFDISNVYRNADRIAFGSKAEFLKAASDGLVHSGAELAELAGINAPLSMVLEHAQTELQARQMKLAYALSELEEQVESQPWNRQERAVARAFTRSVQPPMDITPLGKVGSHKLATGLNALASQNVLLPVNDFLRLFVGEDSVKYASLAAEVPGLLPGVYTRLIASDDLGSQLQNNPFTPSQGLAPESQRQWVSKYAETHSLDPQPVQLRASLSAIRDTSEPGLRLQTEKSASASGEANNLARCYALYKLAFLDAQDGDVALTSEYAIRQNYVI